MRIDFYLSKMSSCTHTPQTNKVDKNLWNNGFQDIEHEIRKGNNPWEIMAEPCNCSPWVYSLERVSRLQHRGELGGVQWAPLVKETELRLRGRTSLLQSVAQSIWERNCTGRNLRRSAEGSLEYLAKCCSAYSQQEMTQGCRRTDYLKGFQRTVVRSPRELRTVPVTTVRLIIRRVCSRELRMFSLLGLQ